MVAPVHRATVNSADGTAWKKACGEALTRAQRPLLVLDYDGTLAEIVAKPELAAPTRELLGMLESAIAASVTVAVVSGRDAPTLQKWLGHLPIHLVSEHGGAHRKPGSVFVDRVPPSALTWFPTARAILAEAVAMTDGAMLESKATSFSFHYRNADPGEGERAAHELAARLRQHLPDNVELHHGKKVLEVRPAGVHKGGALGDLARLTKADFVMAAGDDRTDEDMFAHAGKDAWTIKIGPGETKARARLDGVPALRGFLNEVIAARLDLRR